MAIAEAAPPAAIIIPYPMLGRTEARTEPSFNELAAVLLRSRGNELRPAVCPVNHGNWKRGPGELRE